MTDQRPRYGEYATPEEQRRLAGLPPIGEESIETSSSPEAPAVRPSSAHPVDRFVTIALLAYGLVHVIMSGFAYLDPTAVMNQTLGMLGIAGEFTNYAEGRTWGTIAAIVLVVGWVLTAIAATRRLRRGRISWWIPLVGAVVTTILASLCLMVPMIGDPAFVDYLTSFTP